MREQDKVAIVGRATGYDKAPFEDPSFDIYSINGSCWDIKKRVTADFNCHRADHILKLDIGVGSGGMRFIEENPDIPVYTFGAIPGHANVKALPVEEICTYFNSTYFTSGPAWALAYSLMNVYDEIHLYGMHMQTDEEYVYQRQGLEYLIGWADGYYKATGKCKVVLPEGCELLTQSHIYGIEDAPWREGAISEFMLSQEVEKHQEVIEQLKSQLNFEAGAVSMANAIATQIMKVKREGGEKSSASCETKTELPAHVAYAQHLQEKFGNHKVQLKTRSSEEANIRKVKAKK